MVFSEFSVHKKEMGSSDTNFLGLTSALLFANRGMKRLLQSKMCFISWDLPSPKSVVYSKDVSPDFPWRMNKKVCEHSGHWHTYLKTSASQSIVNIAFILKFKTMSPLGKIRLLLIPLEISYLTQF